MCPGTDPGAINNQIITNLAHFSKLRVYVKAIDVQQRQQTMFPEQNRWSSLKSNSLSILYLFIHGTLSGPIIFKRSGVFFPPISSLISWKNVGWTLDGSQNTWGQLHGQPPPPLFPLSSLGPISTSIPFLFAKSKTPSFIICSLITMSHLPSYFWPLKSWILTSSLPGLFSQT